MSKFGWSRRDEERRAEQLSRAVHFPDLDWDESTRQIMSMGRLLEPGIAPDEQARSGWKEAMLEEFDRTHGQATPMPGAIVIADIEPVSPQEATEVAARFTAMLAERMLEQ